MWAHNRVTATGLLWGHLTLALQLGALTPGCPNWKVLFPERPHQQVKMDAEDVSNLKPRCFPVGCGEEKRQVENKFVRH